MGFLGTRFGLSRYEADENYHKALDYYSNNNLDQAVLHMNSAIELQPKIAEYYAARGFFRLEDGVLEEAAADFEQALTINGYEVLANYGSGVLAYRREEYDMARDYFMNAWAADSERPEILYYLGMVYHRLRDNTLAHYWMEQASKHYETLENREARRRKRNCERWLKVFDKLIAEADEASQSAPES